jgi:hypothetical protein
MSAWVFRPTYSCIRVCKYLSMFLHKAFLFVVLLVFFFSCNRQSDVGGVKAGTKRQEVLPPTFYIGADDSAVVFPDTLSSYIKQIDVSSCKSIESELRMVYVRDQWYRDSLQSIRNIDADARRYFTGQLVQSDQINADIVRHILDNVGWARTCHMDDQSNMGIWMTIFHSRNVEFKSNALKYIEQAFEDSILTPELYAFLMDNIYVNTGRKQLYGTYPGLGRLDFPYRTSISIDSVNLERELIGLEKIGYDEISQK